MTRRIRGVLPYAATALLALAAACGDDNNNNNSDGGNQADGGTALGSGALTSAAVAANGSAFSLPFDSAPGPDGQTIYFTGVVADGGLSEPAILKVAASGGATTTLAAGGAIGAPFSLAVSSDGNTVFVADPAFATANDKGAIFSLSASGGAPTELAETADYAPFSIALAKVSGADTLVFTGTDKATGASGIFKDVSGTVSTVIEGGAAGDPGAVAIDASGTIYFAGANGNLYSVASGASTATAITTSALALSFPGGLAVSQDGKYLLVPDTDPATHGESIARVAISGGAVTQLGLSLSANSEAGGLHRAANADVYAFVDTGAQGTGAVYILK